MTIPDSLQRALWAIGLASLPVVVASLAAAPTIISRGPDTAHPSALSWESQVERVRSVLFVHTRSSIQDTTPLYFEYQVEQPARVLEWKHPRYPDSLKLANVEGEVMIRFIVDTIGRMERGSAHILRASHAAFASAVMATLESARFTPAFLNVEEGRRVRQVVQQAFLFAQKR